MVPDLLEMCMYDPRPSGNVYMYDSRPFGNFWALFFCIFIWCFVNVLVLLLFLFSSLASLMEILYPHYINTYVAQHHSVNLGVQNGILWHVVESALSIYQSYQIHMDNTQYEKGMQVSCRGRAVDGKLKSNFECSH